MSDEPTNPAQTDAPAPTASAPSEPTFTAADVERILAAERSAVPTPVDDDPVARFRSTVRKTAKPAPAAPAQQDAVSRLTELMTMQLAQTMAGTMKPPAPPRTMSVDEKLSSSDPNVWLGRDPNAAFSAQDRAALHQRHASALAREGFKGDVAREAELRTSRELSTAFTRAVGNVPVAIDPLASLPDWIKRRG